MSESEPSDCPVSADTSTNPTPSRADSRSASRLGAVQALFQLEMTGGAPRAVATEFIIHRLGQTLEGATYLKADDDFFIDLVTGSQARLAEIDEIVSTNLSSEWSIGRLDRPLRQILRLAIYELIARPDVPGAVVINEYLDVAHAFYSGSEAKFANGFLDSVARKFDRLNAGA